MAAGVDEINRHIQNFLGGEAMKERKTSITKKLMALCLTVIFVFSMSLSAFAQIDADSTGTVTVTGLESDNGANITAYKIIDVNFDITDQQLEEPVKF